jgi:hypothetical protein
MATLGAAESIVDALEMAAAEGVREAEFDAEAAKARCVVRPSFFARSSVCVLRSGILGVLAAAARLMIRDWANPRRLGAEPATSKSL